jgi:hypothetical protein
MASSKKVNALQKERQAELRKKFFKTLGELCTQLLGENVLRYLPKDQLERLYLIRIRDFKFTFQHNHIVDETVVEHARKTVYETYYEFKLPYGSLQNRLSHCQTDIYLTLLYLYINSLNNESFANAALFLDKTKPISQIILSEADQIQRITHTNLITCNYFHIVPQYYVKGSCTVENLPPVGDIIPSRFSYHYEWIKSTTLKFNIEGNVRPAIQLLNTLNQPELPPITLTAAQLGLNTPFANIPLDIYIQHHAINRIMERLDALQPAFIHLAIVTSLLTAQIDVDSHGNRLIVVKYESIKLGYLRVDVVEGCLLIRTFLLFTQDSTPEGEKIKQCAGFQKEDITYLKLDKISAFLNLDASENSRWVKLLKQCGLSELLESHVKLKSFIKNNANLHIQPSVDHYLNINSPSLAESEWV